MSDINNQDDYNYTQIETDDVDIEPVEYDDTLTDYVTPDVNDVYTEHEVLTPYQLPDVIDDTYAIDDVHTDALPEIEQPALRSSARNHQSGRWVARRGNYTIRCNAAIPVPSTNFSYAFNMTVKDGIDKLGNIAVDSIRKEMQQMCEKDVWDVFV
jgi:hypothetical protein